MTTLTVHPQGSKADFEIVARSFLSQVLADGKMRSCAAAVAHGKMPRRISFPRTCATILAAWPTRSPGRYRPQALATLLEQIPSLQTPDRPGRIEPRVLKRRRHRDPLMRKPRRKLKQCLEHATRCGKTT